MRSADVQGASKPDRMRLAVLTIRHHGSGVPCEVPGEISRPFDRVETDRDRSSRARPGDAGHSRASQGCPGWPGQRHWAREQPVANW